MDPDEALRLIRLTIKQMRVDEDRAVREAHADEIAEYFEGLDQWLSRDGFLPADWKAEEDKTPAVVARTGDMEMGEALSYGIFAINTLMHPDASAAADLDRLEANSDDAVEALYELRQIYNTTKEK